VRPGPGHRRVRQRAIAAVAGLTGVRGIADDIEIFSDIGAADVTGLVEEALIRYGLLPGDTDIQVAASRRCPLETMAVRRRRWPPARSSLPACCRAGVGFVRAAYQRVAGLDAALRCVEELSARTAIFDIEPLVAYWDSGQEALERGVALLVMRACQLPEVQVVCFATNSARAARRPCLNARAPAPGRTAPH